MSEGSDGPPIDPEDLPLPEVVRPREGQQAGGSHQALVPEDIIETEGGGLSAVTFFEDLHAVLRLGRQVGPVLRVVFRDADRRLRRGDRLQEELTDERVAHARTDERLRQGQMQAGTQAFLTALGGTILGFGLAELRAHPSWFDGVTAAVGLVMIAVGTWPILSARSGRAKRGPAGDAQNG